MSQVPSQAIKAESQPSNQEDDPAYVNLKVKQQVFLTLYELCKTSAPNTIKDAAHGFMGSAHVG
jgi:hypothetical protein